MINIYYTYIYLYRRKFTHEMYTRQMEKWRKTSWREQKHEFIIKYKHQTIGEKEERICMTIILLYAPSNVYSLMYSSCMIKWKFELYSWNIDAITVMIRTFRILGWFLRNFIFNELFEFKFQKFVEIFKKNLN